MNPRQIVLFILLIPAILIGQSEDNSYYQKHITNTGKSTKFVDYSLASPSMSTTVVVREVITEQNVDYFLLISTYSSLIKKTYRSAFTYDEVVTILMQLQQFEKEILNDQHKIQFADYIENKYRTEDNYAVGYWVSKDGKTKWFIQVDEYSNYGVIDFKDFEDLYNVFLGGQSKIDELKQASQ